MITPEDVRRWVEEAGPALQGAFVHRVWRQGDAWVLLARHHEEGDPGRRPLRRVALEAATEAEGARCVALPTELVDADDRRAKKAQARDAHPLLSLLRRHLVGARFEGVRAVEGERIVEVSLERLAPSPDAPEATEAPDTSDEDLDGPDDDASVDERPDRRPAEARPGGEPGPLALLIELIGRAGNLVLARPAPGRSAGLGPGEGEPTILAALHPGGGRRPLQPGAPYRLPPPRPAAPPGAPKASGAGPDSPWGDIQPDPEALPLGQAVARAQRAAEEEARLSSRHGQLRQAARKALKRAQGVLAKLETQLGEVAKADEHERLGDLIKANLGTLERRGRAFALVDYSSGEPAPVELELEPGKSPQDHMKALYKRARKLRAGEVSVRTRQGEADAQLEALRAVAAELDDVDPTDEEALDAIEDALRRLKALPPAKTQRVRQQENQGPRSFRTLEGHEVLVGRNDDENDELTMRVARGNDLFFHTRGCPGSHVILRVDPRRPPNHDSILDAASLAVYYSKARNRGACDVSYTPRKWVKKPRGAKPGLVQISNEKSVRAGNDPERLRRVLETARRAEEDSK